MTVSSLKASPTQASDNRPINTLPLLSVRIKVEDEEHNDKEEGVKDTRKSLILQKEGKKIASDCIYMHKN